MMAASYKTKKELKLHIGQHGKFCVVGPAPYIRKWYAEVTMEGGLIKAVK